VKTTSENVLHPNRKNGLRRSWRVKNATPLGLSFKVTKANTII
jgi:hypothetical protein